MKKRDGLCKNSVVADESSGIPVFNAEKEVRGRGITVLEVVSTDTLGEATVRNEIAAHAMGHVPIGVLEAPVVVFRCAYKPR